MNARHTTDADAQPCLFDADTLDRPAMSYDPPIRPEAPVAPAQTLRTAPHNKTRTSKDAARIVTESGQLQQEEGKILRLLASMESVAGLTRHEIADRGGLALCAVCGRIGDKQGLVARGLCEVRGTRKAPGGGTSRGVVFITETGRAAVKMEQAA